MGRAARREALRAAPGPLLDLNAVAPTPVRRTTRVGRCRGEGRGPCVDCGPWAASRWLRRLAGGRSRARPWHRARRGRGTAVSSSSPCSRSRSIPRSTGSSARSTTSPTGRDSRSRRRPSSSGCSHRRAKPSRRAGVRADYRWAAGEPGRAILDAARDAKAAVVVLGEHHHGFLAGLFGTDVAAAVERELGSAVIVA